MDKSTIKKAQDIIDTDGVLMRSEGRGYYHFEVRQASGKWTEVMYSPILGWSCLAIGLNRSKRKWSCSLFTGDKTVPFCSHTLAAQRFMEGKKSE